MPAGCDFTCRNDDCEYCGTGFTITAPWPMGDIDDIINSERIKELPELKQQIQELKNTGREYALITFPNKEGIKTKCYRVNLWSIGAECLWQYDVFLDDLDSLDEAIKKAGLPKKCPTTGSSMLNFQEAIQKGIQCPKCSEKLHQCRWFTKEK